MDIEGQRLGSRGDAGQGGGTVGGEGLGQAGRVRKSGSLLGINPLDDEGVDRLFRQLEKTGERG